MRSRFSPLQQLERITDVYLRARPHAHWAEVETLRHCIAVWIDQVDLARLEAAAEDLALRAHQINPSVVDGYVAFWATRGGRARRRQ